MRQELYWSEPNYSLGSKEIGECKIDDSYHGYEIREGGAHRLSAVIHLATHFLLGLN